MSECIRPWEKDLRSPDAIAEHCTQAPSKDTKAGGDRDAHGCIPSAGYQWCETMSACIRPWEQGLASVVAFSARCGQVPAISFVGSDPDAHGCIASAGYQWCEAMSECIRPWEKDLRSPDAI